LATIGFVYCGQSCFSPALIQLLVMEQSLNAKLAELECFIEQSMPLLAEANRAFITHLIEMKIDAGARRTGDSLPEFALPNLHGRIVTSQELLSHGPLVLIFYRGRWCGFCSQHLEAVAAASPEIAALGARVVAISAETKGRGLALQEPLMDRVEFLVDADLGVALQFGLVFRLPEHITALLATYDIETAEIYGNVSGFLPVPATYIIARDGRIARHFVDANWRRRMEPREIIEAVRELVRSPAPSQAQPARPAAMSGPA
jgi:peroxiredoxin